MDETDGDAPEQSIAYNEIEPVPDVTNLTVELISPAPQVDAVAPSVWVTCVPADDVPAVSVRMFIATTVPLVLDINAVLPALTET